MKEEKKIKSTDSLFRFYAESRNRLGITPWLPSGGHGRSDHNSAEVVALRNAAIAAASQERVGQLDRQLMLDAGTESANEIILEVSEAHE